MFECLQRKFDVIKFFPKQTFEKTYNQPSILTCSIPAVLNLLWFVPQRKLLI